MKIVFYLILAVMIVVLLFLAFYLIVGYFSYKFALTRKGGMVKKIQKKYTDYLKLAEIDMDYYKDFNKIEIFSHDNLKLKGFCPVAQVGQEKKLCNSGIDFDKIPDKKQKKTKIKVIGESKVIFNFFLVAIFDKIPIHQVQFLQDNGLSP